MNRDVDDNPAAELSVAKVKSKEPSNWGCWFLLFAIGFAIFSALYAVRARYGDPTPEITGESFTAARQRWRAADVDDYDIEIEVTNGGKLERYEVVVRDGTAETATRNGAPLTNRRTFETWSVPGMFGTVDSDWQHIDKRLSGKADASTLQLTVRTEFDSEYGYPKKYRRIEWGSAREVSWKVTRFERQPRAAKPASE